MGRWMWGREGGGGGDERGSRPGGGGEGGPGLRIGRAIAS